MISTLTIHYSGPIHHSRGRDRGAMLIKRAPTFSSKPPSAFSSLHGILPLSNEERGEGRQSCCLAEEESLWSPQQLRCDLFVLLCSISPRPVRRLG